jgi:hypothetical protein
MCDKVNYAGAVLAGELWGICDHDAARLDGWSAWPVLQPRLP